MFKGHQDLILGFNLFLPPGHKIEVGTNGTIIVHTPAGRHCVGDHGLVPVTSPDPSIQTSPVSRRQDADQSTQRGRGRGRGRSTVCAETTRSTSSRPSGRGSAQQRGSRGKKRSGAAAKDAPAAKNSRQSVEEEEEDELKQHIRVMGLPLRFRDPTLGDGNCWFNACCDQVNILRISYISINETDNI